MKNKAFLIISILFILSAVSLTFWIVIKNIAYENPIAFIYKNGVLTEKIELNYVTEPYDIIIKGENGETNTITVKKGEIAITDADCPDKTCIKTGSISSGIVPIICLPNRVEIIIQEGKTNADAVLR